MALLFIAAGLLVLLIFLIRSPLASFAIFTEDLDSKRVARGVLVFIVSLLLAACLFGFFHPPH